MFVNDGSTDGTERVLRDLVDEINGKGGRATLVSLKENKGKAEAIRTGVAQYLRDAANGQTISFTDADLSTPLPELLRLERVMAREQSDIVIGSRVALLGRNIVRSNVRHYIGRLSATFISVLLSLKVYDSQAGAKVFSRSAAEAVFRDRFVSRWLFDCEILLRAKKMGLKVFEEPLMIWIHHGQDSKISLPSYLLSLKELFRIARAYRNGY